MSAALRQDDPLRVFLSGKRRAPRIEVQMPVVIRGATSEIAGHTIDLSEGGTLVCVDAKALGESADNELGYLRFVDEQWSDGFDISFTDHAIVAEATLVRLAPRDEDNVLFLGCKFVHDLSKTQQRLLGLRDDDPHFEPRQSVPMEVLPLIAADEPVSALLYADSSYGPRYIGRLVAAGGQAIAIDIGGVSLSEARRVLQGELSVDVRVGTRLLWTTPATFAGVRFLDRPGGGVQVALVGESKLPRKLRKALKRRI